MNDERNKGEVAMGKLIVEVDFPTGTSRERLMELLSDVLYKPDVNVFDPMPIEEHDWEKIEATGISFCYSSIISEVAQQEGSLTYEKLKSLFLHKAVLDELRKDWDKYSAIAYDNIEKWKEFYRPDGMTVRYLDEWVKVLDKGFTAVSRVVLGVDEHSCDLRQNSPFAGVLSDEQRLMVLYKFQEYWANNFEKKVDE